MKRGLGARPLMASEIKQAQKVSRSGVEAATYLGVSYPTYKKWAKLHGVFTKENFIKNTKGYGSKTSWYKGRYPLKEVLEGKHPQYNSNRLFRRLIRTGVKAEECESCGFHERRITDNKVPLKMNHIDGDKSNHKWENIEFLCYNCYFLQVGNSKFKMDDPY